MRDAQRALAQRAGGTDQLPEGFALGGQRREKSAALSRRPASVDQCAHKRRHRFGIEIATCENSADRVGKRIGRAGGRQHRNKTSAL